MKLLRKQFLLVHYLLSACAFISAQPSLYRDIIHADSLYKLEEWEKVINLLEKHYSLDLSENTKIKIGPKLARSYLGNRDVIRAESIILELKRIPSFFDSEIPSQLAYLTDCNTIINYIQGNPTAKNLEDLSRDCMQKGFSKEEKEIVYNLLCDQYYFEPNSEKFDSVYKKLLIINPEFSPDSSSNWFHLDSLYKRKPVWGLDLLFGFNQVYPNLFKDFDLDNTRADNNYYSSNNFSPQGGASVNIPLKNIFKKRTTSLYQSLFLSFGGFLQQSIFESNKSPLRTTDSLTFSSRRFLERHRRFDFPLLVKWRPTLSKTNAYFLDVQLGTSFNILQKAEIIDLFRETDAPDGSASDNSEDESFNVTNQRSSINVSAIVGLGIQTKIFKRLFGGRGYLTFNVRGQFFLLDFVKSGQRYSTPKLNYSHAYAHSNYRWNQTNLTIGFTHYFFKPKLLKGNTLPF